MYYLLWVLSHGDASGIQHNGSGNQGGRTPAVFEIQEAALKARVKEEAFELVQVTASGFKWPDTLATIDSAIEDGDLTAEKGATIKESIRLLSLIYSRIELKYTI